MEVAKKTNKIPEITEADNMNISNQSKDDHEKKVDTDYNNLPEEKSHWEKYQLYYLVFGSLFLTIIIILISNVSTNRQIRKINDRLDGKIYSSYFDSDSNFSIIDYLSRLKNEPFPDHVKKRVKSEIEKIANSSLNGHTKENREEWVENVMSFPWHQISTENNNLNEVKEALNKNHFGMEKVKETIIEHLAEKEQAKKKFGKVLCLVGSPGTGKTSIAKSIAQALGRPFEKFSLGGVHDEAEIRGHRSTYVSSKPGIIVQACQRAKVKNPVIAVDEIDKLGESKYHGNPAAAFLEIFDPEQNEKFRDHYIELPVDLSQIMFICTANQMETIPEPLRDRMEIIEIPSYTKNDKQGIAEKHLIPKLLNNRNLTKGQLTFESSAIQKIIDDYTWEPGIRSLQRALEGIIRKVSLKIITGELKSENITAEKVREYLGKPTAPDLTFEADYSEPGVVNGLSVYSPEIGGGDVLPIEVILVAGTGKIITTGNLKKTMEESAKVAISYVKANANAFGINTTDQTKPNFFNFAENDIHIHVPKGGIPKDGPSAGTALTTTIISALTKKKIDKEIGMTGEITLHGQVSGIGGLREKINAAYRKGLKTVFVPKSNEKDADDISPEVQNKLDIIPVNNYREIWEKLKPYFA